MRSYQLATIFISVMLLLSAVPFTGLSEQNPPEDRGDGVLETPGDWIIEAADDVTYQDEEIIVNGNITVDGILTLINCIVIMNSSYSTFNVLGELNIRDTNISASEDLYYYFRIFGTLDLVNCHLTNMAGEKQLPYEGGLQIHSDDISIDGGSITQSEFTGIYITKNIVLRNFSITNNIFNAVITGSSPQFHDCIVKNHDSENIYLFNGSHPYLVDGDIGVYRFEEEENCAISYAHKLSVHVAYENGSSIEGALITAESDRWNHTDQALTGSDGWMRNMILPTETDFDGGGEDQLYKPYRISAEKFGLKVLNQIPFEDSTELHVILTGDYFGHALTRGDFNGDSLQDLAVGVPRNTTGIQTPGAVFVFINDGSLELQSLDESMADLRIEGEDDLDFGSNLAAGDINGDGKDDLLIGAPGSDENGIDSGRVFFFFGTDEPSWNEYGDADLFLDGDPGTEFGTNMLIGDLNGDIYQDFLIGDTLHTYVYYGSSDPVDDLTAIGESTSFPTTKGDGDTTGEHISLIQANDDDRYAVQDPNSDFNKMHLTNFSIGNLNGKPTGVTLRIQYTSDRYYGYNDHERAYIYYYDSADGEWHESLRPRYNNDDWRDETTLTFDLFEAGITTLEQIENIAFWMENIDGTVNSQAENDIFFDYFFIDITASPTGANHTLGPGNLSIGDVNGDGANDLLVANDIDQIIYYGGPLGISAPNLLDVENFVGEKDHLYAKERNLSIADTMPAINGQFDDGWNKWTFVENSEGQKDDVRMRLQDEENGDWWVHDGPAGSFGSPEDTLSNQNSARNCRGMLRSIDFLITEEMEILHFWYHFRARSFEGTQDQGDDIDRVRYGLYNAATGELLQELAGWFPPGGSDEHEDDGIVDANITGLAGETVYFGMEIISNGGNRDKAIAQVDNITFRPLPEKPYFSNGSFTSEIISFEHNLTSLTPSWQQELNNGTISVKFRTDVNESWENISAFTSGLKFILPAPANQIQYRIEMTGDEANTPVFRSLSIGYLLEGQMRPTSLSTDHTRVEFADVNGDGSDDLLFLLDPNSRSGGLDIHYGSENFDDDYDEQGISSFYSGDVIDYSTLDLEIDGSNEVVVVGSSIHILDSTGSSIWEQNSIATNVADDIASYSQFELNTGAVYFIPSYDNDLRIISMDIPSLVQPDSEFTINISIGNAGINDITDLPLYLNITGPGYSQPFNQDISIASLESGLFSFAWNVPAEEGVTYTLSLEANLDDDRVPGNNVLVIESTSMKHDVEVISPTPVLEEHGGDEFVFPITITNVGTFATEDVTLDASLPAGWTGSFYFEDQQISEITVIDTINITYRTTSPADEVDGDYDVDLTFTAASAQADLDLTATVLRPDLVIEEIALYRADGVKTNGSLHGVEGDHEIIEVTVTNNGPTYSTSFHLELRIDDSQVDEFNHEGLAPGESAWFTYEITPSAEILDVEAIVDYLSEVPEMDENNNDLQTDFTIKTTDPVGDFVLSGVVLNIHGEGVDLAEIDLQWGDEESKVFTDENGTFSHTISALEYTDTMALYINATDGKNLTALVIIMYSEDGGIFVTLILNQFIIDVSGPDTVSSIETGGEATIVVELTNLGNSEATYIITTSELPTGWTVTFQDVTDGKITLALDEVKSVTVIINASANPRYSEGFQRYFLTILVYSEIYPDSNDTFTHAVEVAPNYQLVVSVQDDFLEATPYQIVRVPCVLRNEGNLKDTLIPEIIGFPNENFWFDVAYILLEIDQFDMFDLWFIMPNIPSGTTLDLEIGTSDGNTQNAAVSITAEDYHELTVTLMDETSAKPGDTMSLPINVWNTGNLPVTVDLDVQSMRDGLVGIPTTVEIPMDTEVDEKLDITLPLDGMSGEIITVHVIVVIQSSTYFLNLTVNITVLENFGMDMVKVEETIVPDSDYTIYHYEIDATNTGNGINTYYFKAVGTDPEFISLPSPITLSAGETDRIQVDMIIPINRTTVVDNYLIPTDGVRDFIDINLRVISHYLRLDTDVTTSQNNNTYYYDVMVMNNGSRFELIDVIVNLPKVASYKAGDKRWEGKTDKDVLELEPGETGMFTISLTTPELRDYWGSDLTVDLESNSGKSKFLNLPKPPIAILGVTIPSYITIEDSLTFTGSQSYWNIIDYQWDFGDDATDSGSTVTHSFTKSGDFDVVLTVTDDNGFTATRIQAVSINNQPPIVMVVASPRNRTVEVDQPIKFDASVTQDRDGEIVSYSWDFGYFGDYFEGVFPVIEHSYDQPDTYYVTLTVTDNLGATVNTTFNVIVKTKSTTHVEEDVIIEEKVVTDPMSYLPVALILIVVLAGIIIIIRKRSFLNHMQDKLDEDEK